MRKGVFSMLVLFCKGVLVFGYFVCMNLILYVEILVCDLVWVIVFY